MVALPGVLGVVSRFVRRGSLYLLPPIRFNMPVNINRIQSKQLFKVGNRVFSPKRLTEITVQYEYLWPDFEKWEDHEHHDAGFKERSAKFGEPRKRVFGARVILDDGEILFLNARKYWKLYGVLMQIGIEI